MILRLPNLSILTSEFLVRLYNMQTLLVTVLISLVSQALMRIVASARPMVDKLGLVERRKAASVSTSSSRNLLSVCPCRPFDPGAMPPANEGDDDFAETITWADFCSWLADLLMFAGTILLSCQLSFVDCLGRLGRNRRQPLEAFSLIAEASHRV